MLLLLLFLSPLPINESYNQAEETKTSHPSFSKSLDRAVWSGLWFKVRAREYEGQLGLLQPVENILINQHIVLNDLQAGTVIVKVLASTNLTGQKEHKVNVFFTKVP